MMRTKNYKYGNWQCRSTYRPVGHGYEVTFYMGTQPVFVGNFIHTKEANQWWQTMNTELKKFTTQYWTGPKAPVSWYREFISNHLYQVYYTYLDKTFTTYHKTYKKAFHKTEKKYYQYKKTWHPTHKNTLKRAA